MRQQCGGGRGWRQVCLLMFSCVGLILYCYNEDFTQAEDFCADYYTPAVMDTHLATEAKSNAFGGLHPLSGNGD